ncbi:MAG: glycosyltransferase family 39 protein [Anaerolineae bacterium]|nr:glycosyltransferase family 39 protein [Anaerolineae bacterium]
MPDWLQPTVALLPYAAWVFLGVGVPWALAVLPRAHWGERGTVLAVGMALGPLLHTAWLFALGTLGALTLAPSLIGSGALAALGAALAARRGWRAGVERSPAPPARARSAPPAPHSSGERLLIAGIALLLALNVLVTAYWPFIAYDTQWVYGYNARVFVLEERIPDDMGYYPQLVPLLYATMQQAWAALGGDALNDHAARAVIPWLNAAMVLMAYTLGRRAFGGRRVALLTAAAWALYPHVAAWAGAGDLEIVLTLYATGAAAYFVEAWRTERARPALVSGLLLAGALWTKPTGGALILGVLLALAGALLAARGRPAALWPKLRVALIVGLACAPLGGMWYARNLLLGHTAVDFPAAYWHDFAQRSGQEFGWLLLIAGLVAGALTARNAGGGGVTRLVPLIAMLLLLAGTLPTAWNADRIRDAGDVWLWLRGDINAGGRMGAPAWALVAAGVALLAWAGRVRWRALPGERRSTVLLLWALLLPYAAVWFLDFSYHYRLSFAIVPLLAVQVAALVDGWLWDWLAARRIRRTLGALATGTLIAVAAWAGVQHTVEAWRDGGLPDDAAKYDRGNPALMVVVRALEQIAAGRGDLVVAIPGEDRLPFFFPAWEIRNSRDPADLPLRLEDLEGVDVFVNTSVGVFLMQWSGQWPNSLQADADLAALYHQLDVRGPDGTPWPTVLEPIPLSPDGSLPVDDGNFRYTAFTVHPEARFAPMTPGAAQPEEVLFGDWARLVGHDLGNLKWQRGQRIVLTLYWQPTAAAPPPRDYSVYVHLLTPDGTLLRAFDGEPAGDTYPTRFWRPGESLLDYRILRVPEDIPPGPAILRIGLYDPLTHERLPVTVGGAPAGDGLTIETRIVVR